MCNTLLTDRAHLGRSQLVLMLNGFFVFFSAKKLTNEEQECYKQRVDIENLEKELNSLKKACTEQNDAVSCSSLSFLFVFGIAEKFWFCI